MKKTLNTLFAVSIGLMLMLILGAVGGQVLADNDDSETHPLDLPQIYQLSPDSTEPRVTGSWWDGQIQYTTVINYLGYAEYGFGTWVGYWQNVELGHPQVNELYLVKVSVYGVGSPASGQQAAVINFQLPPNTQIDTSTYAIRCFGGPEMLEFTDGCPQSLPYNNLSTRYNIPSGEYGNVWPIAAGAGWEFWVPVKTSVPLSGDNFMGAIDNIEAMNTPDALYPTVPIYVFSTSTLRPGAFNKIRPANGAVDVPIDTNLEWGDSANATTYEYCMDTSNDNACAPWVDFSIPFNALSPNTTYFWHIRAVNSAGVTYADGSSTAFWSFTTEEAAAAPGAFSKMAPLNGSVDQPTNLTLTWGESTGTAAYEYCYDTSNDNDCTNWVNNGMSTSKSISGLAPDTTYYWHVRAVNDVGTTYANGLSTAYWSFRTEEPVSPPGAFSKANPADGATDTPTNLTLHWGTSSGATSYEYCYDTSNNNACTTWVNNGTSTNKSLSGLVTGTTYYWHVRAKNSDGVTYSNESAEAFWSFTTQRPTWADDGVLAMAVQADGKILIGGYFTLVNGVSRNHIARLNPDGSLDLDFDPNIDGRVDAIALQPDGKILVGGGFEYVGLDPRNWITRLNPNGTLDASFNPTLDGTVYAILVQPDGNILIGGNFTKVNGITRTHIALLTKEGILDTSFRDINLDNIVRTLAAQPDGKTLIGGAFKYVNSEKRTFIARLDKDGHLDDTFNPDFDNYLMNLVVQPDGKILVGGQFTEVNGEAHAHITRLQPSGELDKYFFAQANDSIVSIALQADGKMILGGYFTEVNSETHNRIVRLDEEGDVDHTLYLDADGLVTAVGLQHNGTILLGGLFDHVNGEFRPKITRFINNTSAKQTLTINPAGDQITWSLGNASPQVYRVTYELSTNGILYTDLGDATYIGGKWQLDNLTLPEEQDISIRARGYYSVGRFNSSGSILETIITARIEKEESLIYLPLVLN